MNIINYHYSPFALLLFFLVMFPYISLVNTPFDTQPYALAFSGCLLILIFLMKKDLAIPKMLIPFLVVCLFAIIRTMLQFDTFNALRSLVGYISVFLIALAGYHTFKYIKGKYFIAVVIIWSFFGLVQSLVSKSFGSGIVARMSTSDDRGITSLAVEPSSYSLICIFFLIINDLFYAKKSYDQKMFILIFGLIIFQLLLSRSALGFIAFGVYLLAKFIFNKGISRKVLSFFLIIFLFILFYFLYTEVPSLQQTRVGSLLHQVSINPISLIYHDGSIADRLSHILVSFASLFHSYGLGYGIATWDLHALNIALNSGTFIYDVTQVHFTLGRIMSAWGTAVYELGIVGLLYPISFIYIMMKGAKQSNKEMEYVYKVALVTIFFIMFMSIPIAFPLFGYLIGVFIHEQNRATGSDTIPVIQK